MRRLLAFVPIGLALAVPATATADAPTVETVIVPRHFVFTDACGTFGLIADFMAERRVTTFYDQDGTPITRVIHAKTPGTLTNSVTGKSLPIFGERVITTDLLTGAVRATGVNGHVVVPGMGTVQLGAGQMGIDEDGEPFAHGRLDPAVTDALCEALAGP
jgi:hypothetical protein